MQKKKNYLLADKALTYWKPNISFPYLQHECSSDQERTGHLQNFNTFPGMSPMLFLSHHSPPLHSQKKYPKDIVYSQPFKNKSSRFFNTILFIHKKWKNEQIHYKNFFSSWPSSSFTRDC
jgi:hypothetical protein